MRVLHEVGRRLPSMRAARRVARWVVLPAMLVALVPASTTPGLAAGPQPDPGPNPILGSMLKDLKPLSLDGFNKSYVPALANPNRTISVMVEMQGDPVAVAEANARDAGLTFTADARAQVRAALKNAQDAIVPDIQRLRGDVRYELQHAYNGIHLRIPAGEAAELSKLPGVVAVHAIPLHKIENTSSVPFIGTPAVWQDLGLTGTGVRVGVIDTGIDYHHANFGGSGNPADYAADNRTMIEKGSFPTVKVIGGTDFVGDDFDAASSDPARNTPMPDPDPLDCNGHGSHVAGTAAGEGVRLDRTTYTGPYNGDTPKTGFLVGPGVAPQASLYALKVFGCTGFTDMDVDAVDWAVEHDLDIINMSLGSALGRNTDPSSVAANNAVRAGVVVVASAGNRGDGPFIAGSPAVSDGAIAVAAMDALPPTPFAVVFAGDLAFTMRVSNYSTAALPVTGALRLLENDPATPRNEALGCLAEDYAAVQPGEIVITHRGSCARTDRVFLATQAGAGAVIMINDLPGFPPLEGFQAGAIPFLGTDPGFEPDLVSLNGQTANIVDTGTAPNFDFAHLADFSSAGPRNGDNAQKPDITAPGINISSTAFGTGYNAIQMLGTSMAAPHVAGVAALVRQARPGWSAAEVKAAIINTADPNKIQHDEITNAYRTNRAGAGLVTPANAVATEVVASGGPLGGGLSFGLIESTGITTATKRLTITNKSNAPVTYQLSTEWDIRAGGATMRIEPQTVTVKARKSTAVDVTLRVDASLAPAGVGDIFADIATASGNVVLKPTATALRTLRVPFSASVRGTTAITASPQVVRVADQITITCQADVGFAVDVDALAWGLSDERGDTTGTDLLNVGFEATSGAAAFLFHTAAGLTTASVNEWDILLNTDDDPADDFAVVGVDAELLAGADHPGKRLFTLVIDLDAQALVAAYPAVSRFNGSYVGLVFLLSDVGLTPGGHEQFTYHAGIASLEGFTDDVTDETASYNPFTQPVDTVVIGTVEPGGPLVPLTLNVNQEQLARTPVLGWLIFTPFNKAGEPVQTVKVRS